MGANMLGYTLVKPVKGEAIAKKHLDSIKKVLQSDVNNVKKLYRLNDLCVNLIEYNQYEEVDDEDSESIDRILEGIKNDVAQLETDGLEIPLFRDVNMRYAKIGKKRIEIVFAGELSWGDEPDGLGYKYLKRIVTLGISDKWEAALAK